MGLFGRAKARVRRALLLRFLKGLVKDVQAGEYGQEARGVMEWLKKNKKTVLLVGTFIGAGLVAIGYPEAGEAIKSVLTLLLGGVQ